MRKPVLAVMTGLTALVLGLGIRAGTGGGLSTVAGAASAGVVATTPSSPTTNASSAAASATVNGQAVMTRYGPVQVQVVVASKKVVSARAIDYPTGNGRDQEINSYAIPQLDSEASQSQTGSIDTVSGATFTSEGYIGSLQSAIDQARSAGLL